MKTADKRSDNDRDAPQPGDLDDSSSDTLPCPACRMMVYDDTDRCPHCGQWIMPLAGYRSHRKQIWTAIIVFVLVVALIRMITRMF